MRAAAAQDPGIVPQAQMLRAHADMETGRDQPEPHQAAAKIDCAAMSLGQLRDVLIYSESPALRSKAVSEFEQRIRAAGFAEAEVITRGTVRALRGGS